MRTKINLLYFIQILLISSLLSCNDSIDFNKKGNLPEINEDSLVSGNQKAVQVQIFSFLEWYKSKFDTISSINLIIIPDTEGGLYSINFNNIEEYLKVFVKSKFFSKSFINKKRKYFIDCDERMKREKQNSGPPIGLEYDIILQTQEIENTFDSISKMTFSNFVERGDSASIDIELLNRLKINLIKECDFWLIDEIQLKNRQM